MVHIRIGDHVLCERLGKEEFVVINEISYNEFEVASTADSKKHHIYKALCYVPIKMAFANRARQVEKADKIGRKRR